MAFVYGEFNSEFRDNPIIIGAVDQRSKCYLAAHDAYSGSLVVAKCLGESEGAEVYWFESLDKDRQEVMEKIGSLITPSNVYTQMLPWGRSKEFPLTLDSGEYGYLSIVHRPRLTINPIRIQY